MIDMYIYIYIYIYIYYRNMINGIYICPSSIIWDYFVVDYYIYIDFGDFIDDFSTIWEHRLGFVRNLSGFPTFGGVSYDGGSPVSHHGFQY